MGSSGPSPAVNGRNDCRSVMSDFYLYLTVKCEVNGLRLLPPRMSHLPLLVQPNMYDANISPTAYLMCGLVSFRLNTLERLWDGNGVRYFVK